MRVGINSKLGEWLDKYNRDTFSEELKKYISGNNLEVDEKQEEAWKDCFDFLKKTIPELPSEYMNSHLLFEYMLPLERGRRPDIVMLMNNKVVIFEFKAKEIETNRDIEQTIGYREDIKHFHEVTGRWNLDVDSYLVLTKNHESAIREKKSISIINENTFINVIKEIECKPMEEPNVDKWISSPYNPLPNILEATQKLFQTGELPYIKSIAEGDIAYAIKAVNKIVWDNESIDHKKKIVFVSGVPGSGKTLIGLKTVYDFNDLYYEKTGKTLGAIYLSGNGPLVNVLQSQLSTKTITGTEGKAYIRDMLSFKLEYLETNSIPDQKVIVFDEAQRAWDNEKMRKSYSEVEALLKMADKAYKKNGSITLLCLIGDGQAIHLGEEKGMDLWQQALESNPDWEVYFPEKYEGYFENIQNKNVINDLFLDVSIRNNFIDTSKWIEAILAGDLNKAKVELEVMESKGYRIRVQQDFNKIVKLMEILNEEKPQEKYGLLVSSKANVFDNELKKFTNYRYSDSFVKVADAGKWYLDECKKLRKGASEFLIQGLEIEMPIVVFEGDYYLKNGKWIIDDAVYRKNMNKYKNIDEIIKNIYRVLLSRGRHGMILYIPPSNKMLETFEFFKSMGIQSF